MAARRGEELPDMVLTLVIGGVILFVGIAALSTVVQVGGGETSAAVSTAALLDGTSWTRIDDEPVGNNETIYNSRGYAVNLTGANDSYVETTQSVEIATDVNWTISVWARVDNDSASANMTAFSAAGRVLIYYNGSASNWSVWYYDEGARDSFIASVNATDQPANLTQITVTRNSTHLAIYRNATNSSAVDVTGNSTVSAPVNNSNWDGRLDEVRTFDDHLNASERSSLYSGPVAPFTNATRTARIMFDQPTAGQQLLFFADGSVDTFNASFSRGLPGEELDPSTAANNLAGTSDYEWDTDGPRIRAVDGGQLDGAPVAYVDYDRTDRLGALSQDFTSAVGLAGVLLVIVPLGALVVYLYGIRRPSR